MPLSIPNPISFEGFIVGGTVVTSKFAHRTTTPKSSMTSALSDIQHRMEIHDLSRLEKDSDPSLPKFLQAHFNPQEVKLSIKVMWTEVAIPGMSHKRLHYHLTENIPFKFDLHFDTMQTVGKAFRGAQGPTGTKQAERFLQSLCYAKAGAQTVDEGAPPRVLFYWPNFLSVNCVVEQQDWSYTMFHSDGTPRRFTCSMTLKEIRSTRLSSSQVLHGGSQRNEPYPPLLDIEENIIKVS